MRRHAAFIAVIILAVSHIHAYRIPNSEQYSRLAGARSEMSFVSHSEASQSDTNTGFKASDLNNQTLRIVSLAPNITEIAIALGAEKNLAAVCEECSDIQRIGLTCEPLIRVPCGQYGSDIQRNGLTCEPSGAIEALSRTESNGSADKAASAEIASNTKDKYSSAEFIPGHSAALFSRALNVGSPVNPDIEKIISLKPDMVISSSLTSEAALVALERAGVSVFQTGDIETLSDVYTVIRNIGNAFGKATEAEALAEALKSRIDELRKKSSEIKDKKSAVYIIGIASNGLLYAATRDTYISDLIESAGLTNAANGKYWTISSEALVSSNPDCIFIPNGMTGEIIRRTLENQKPYTVLSGKIIELDPDIIERPGISCLCAVCLLHSFAYGTEKS